MRAVVVALVLVRPAHAQDEFEIQVYDAATAPAGEPGLEIHLNHHLIHDAPDQTHLTLEPHYGALAWLELGGYLQSSLATGGNLEYAGVKLRAKLRWPERVWDRRLGLAINFEVSAVPWRFEANAGGIEVRPIVDLQAGRVYAAINPIVSIDTDGANGGHPQLEPAAKLSVVVDAHAMLGVEAYGAFGPIDGLGSGVERLFAVLDLRGSWWDLNAGLGVNRGSPDHPIAKIIFGVHP
jgi:hypothetical protein